MRTSSILALRCSIFFLLLTSCSSKTFVDPQGNHHFAPNDAVMLSYTSAIACCKDISSLPFKKIVIGDSIDTTIDKKSPIFPFGKGRSYFVSYELPQVDKDLSLYIAGYFSGTVFFPVVTFLDENFKVVKFTGKEKSRVKAPTLSPRHFYHRIPMNPVRDDVHYFVVHTTSELLGMSEKNPGPPNGGYVFNHFSPMGDIRVSLTMMEPG